MSVNHFDLQLQELYERAVGRLLTAEVFDAAAFDALEDHLWSLAERLQAEFVISKQILKIIRSAEDTIRSRADYLPSVKENVGRAGLFAELLDRLIAGETKTDRHPGLPRIS
jgi:hypothetical protein